MVDDPGIGFYESLSQGESNKTGGLSMVKEDRPV